jgi:hypothetical protein
VPLGYCTEQHNVRALGAHCRFSHARPSGALGAVPVIRSVAVPTAAAASLCTKNSCPDGDFCGSLQTCKRQGARTVIATDKPQDQAGLGAP